VGNTELLPDRLLRSAVLVTVADVVVHKSEVLHVLDRGRELERPLEWRPKELARSRTERSAHTLASARDLMGHASSQWLDIGDECERAFEVRQEAPIDVAEELVKFTLLTRGVSSYLTDRYSERKEAADKLADRLRLSEAL